MLQFRIHLKSWRMPCFEKYANGDWAAFLGPFSVVFC